MTLSLVVLLVKITCVLLIALCATLAMQRASAGSRHLVWLLALGALLVVPTVAMLAPIELPVLPQAVRAGETGRTGEAVRTDKTDKADRSSTLSEPSLLPGPSGSSDVSALPALPVLLALIWAIIAASLLTRLLFGAFSVRRIVRRGRNLEDPAWQTPLYEIADRLGLEDTPRLLQSDDVKMPFAAGLVEPVIVLPAESESWTADRRSAVLIHELGHIRRRDLIGHTLGRVACALYWFHPLVWTAARRLRAESEQACDDLALVFGARPSDYAEHLLDIVTCVRDHNTPSIALAMAHRKEFEGRMLAILNPDLRRRGPSRTGMASYSFALAGLVFVIGAATPVPRGPEDAGAALGMPTGMQQVASDSPSPSPKPEPELRQRDDRRNGALNVDMSRSTRTDTNISTEVSTRMNISAIVSMALAGQDRALLADTAVVRALIERLKDEDADVREAAAHALGRIGNPMAIPELVKVLDDPQPKVQEAALDALSEFERGVPEEPVRRMLASSNADMRERAIDILMNMRAKGSLSSITSLVSDADADVRQRAVQAIQEMGNPSAAGAIVPALGDNSADVRQAAVQALAELGGSIADAVLDKLLQDANKEVRQATVQYVGERRITTKTSQLIRLLDDTSGDVRQSAAEALTEVRTPESHAALRRALTSTDADVRRIAVEYFGEAGDQ
jgi:HEAT repeat protein/beta-lactamase regulating signal transducer with metallopeptidase domain